MKTIKKVTDVSWRLGFFCRGLIAVAVAGSLTACGFITGIGDDNAPKPTPLCSYKKQFTPKVVWSEKTGVGTDGLYLKLSPVVVGNNIFTADAKGQVCSYDLVTGKAGWCVDTKTSVTTGLAASCDQLFFGTKDGQLVALNQLDGKQVWKTSVPNQLLAVPFVQGNTIFIKTIDGNVCALDKSCGRLIWKYEHATPIYILRDMSLPQVMNGRVIVGFPDGKLAAYDSKDGSLVWERAIAYPAGRGMMSQLVDISADPIQQSNTIYVVTYQGNLAAVSLDSGEVRWEHPLSSYRGMVVTCDAVIVADADSVVWAFDKATGKELWKQEKLKYRMISVPALQGQYVVVGDKSGHVHWISVRNGEFAARTNIKDEEIICSPVVYQNHVHIMTQKGQLVAY